MNDTDISGKIALQGNVPQELIRQIETMRRNPTGFWLRGRASCALGCDRKGQKSSYQLGHANAVEAGTWCPVHGWLSFPSDLLPPTERLTPTEIEDNRLAEQRRGDYERRKQR